MRIGERRNGRIAERGTSRNILTSPWIPSCVLNHFPVDSAVCNPIIGISPSGKLLFYSRTTQVPDVPCTAIFSLSFSPSSPICFTLFLLPTKSILTRPVLESSFFQLLLVASPNPASEFVYFALLNLIVVNSTHPASGNQ